LGIALYELICGKPFHSLDFTFAPWPTISNFVIDFIKRVVSSDVYVGAAILEDEWFKSKEQRKRDQEERKALLEK